MDIDEDGDGMIDQIRLPGEFPSLRDAIDALPDGAFAGGRIQRRTPLQNKVEAIENMIQAGNYHGAISKLEHDLSRFVQQWLVATDPGPGESSKAVIEDGIASLIARLESLSETSLNSRGSIGLLSTSTVVVDSGVNSSTDSIFLISGFNFRANTHIAMTTHRSEPINLTSRLPIHGSEMNHGNGISTIIPSPDDEDHDLLTSGAEDNLLFANLDDGVTDEITDVLKMVFAGDLDFLWS